MINSSIGRCAYCEQPVSSTEGDLVEELWTQLNWHVDPDAYFELIVPMNELKSDQFNAFHEPLLCLSCLKLGIHQESIIGLNNQQTKMRRVCAWCGKELNMNEDLPLDSVITHGICDDCVQGLLRNLNKI